MTYTPKCTCEIGVAVFAVLSYVFGRKPADGSQVMADIHRHARDTESSFELQAVDSDGQSTTGCTGDEQQDSSDDGLYIEDDLLRAD